MYLLDTNACVEYLRQRNAALIARIAATPPSDIRLCSVVKAELYHGAHRSQQAQSNLVKVENFVRPFVSIPFDDDAAREYGRLRADLERRGLVIGPYDLQVAAIALVHGLTLVTHNTKEFRNVSGLSLEDWQVPP
jgi:tRNA(fMet)-specific endonuclease VapC